jgi:Cof subfamily protein (haloacid dehalogenase superfamily)
MYAFRSRRVDNCRNLLKSYESSFTSGTLNSKIFTRQWFSVCRITVGQRRTTIPNAPSSNTGIFSIVENDMKSLITFNLLPALLLVGCVHGFLVSRCQWSVQYSKMENDRSSLSESLGLGDTNPFEEQLRRIRENTKPIMPTSGRPPNKSEIYAEQELEGLWQIHKQLSARKEEQLNEVSFDETGIPSIHDLVMEAVGDFDNQRSNKDAKTPSYPWLTEEIRQRSNKITAIASDVDGTLLGPDQKVHPRTNAAVQKAVQSTLSPTTRLKFFFPATGKSRAGAMHSLGPELGGLLSGGPGVFIQGLYCVIGDTVVFEKRLQHSAVLACEKLVADTKTSIIAYDGDLLYTTDLTDRVIELHEVYGEPLSKEISSIAAISAGVHKILVLDEDADKLTNVVRPLLESLAAAHNATVTQALPTNLELLPGGCSKALGVEKLCEKLGIDPRVELLALGDAENDAEMLRMASIGVVMGNGSPAARAAGDIVLKETCGEGGAGLAIEVLGGI